MTPLPARRPLGEVVQPERNLRAKPIPIRLQRAVDAEHGKGIVAAASAHVAGFVAEARIDTTEMVTARIILGLERLHRLEAMASKENPIEADRYSSLVDDFLMVARGELRRLPKEF